jgi:hypothetical protein
MKATAWTGLVLCGLLAGCGGGSIVSFQGAAPAGSPVGNPSLVVVTPPTPPTPAATAMVEREIAPTAADPTVRTAFEPHFAINPSPAVTARGRLFVFLPGTGATPAVYRLIVRSAAARGLHAVGLNYPNEQAVGMLCNASPEPDCHGQVRGEVFTGEDLSPLVSVGASDSINRRLARLLATLHTLFPAEGWGQYLTAGEPDWSRIRIAGHSQGGGHAAYIAKRRSVDRAIYFSSPADWSTATGQPARWVLEPGVTPALRQFGFTHLQDPLVTYATASAIWQALGLGAFGSPATVDGAAAPYGGSHQLVTDAAPNLAAQTVSPFHGAPVVDSATPRTSNGTPLFEPVWIHLSFD